MNSLDRENRKADICCEKDLAGNTLANSGKDTPDDLKEKKK